MGNLFTGRQEAENLFIHNQLGTVGEKSFLPVSLDRHLQGGEVGLSVAQRVLLQLDSRSFSGALRACSGLKPSRRNLNDLNLEHAWEM